MVLGVIANLVSGRIGALDNLARIRGQCDSAHEERRFGVVFGKSFDDLLSERNRRTIIECERDAIASVAGSTVPQRMSERDWFGIRARVKQLLTEERRGDENKNVVRRRCGGTRGGRLRACRLRRRADPG
jgi:hypothetical protein